MQCLTRFHSLRRLAFTVAILLGMLLPLGNRTVGAQDEKPSNVVAFSNSPGMITITWNHSGNGVYWFVLEQESPPAVGQIDRDKRTWSVPNLKPSRTYRYQVCAVYAYNRKCSSEDGVGYASVTTPPPQTAQGGGPSSGSKQQPVPPPVPKTVPKPVPSPVIAAMPVRFVPGGSPGVHLRWLNPVDVVEYALEYIYWYRNDKLIAQQAIREYMDIDMEPNNSHRYKLCVKNPVHWICSEEIVASPIGVAASFESVNFSKRYIRHRMFLGELTPVNNKLDSQDVAFFVRPGLNGAARSVSFESVNYPGHFLRHQGYRIKLNRNDFSELFGKDATFVLRPGLRNLPDLISFESINFPGYFIRHQNFQLWIAKNDGSQLFRLDASFRQTDHYVGHLRLPVQLQPRSSVTAAEQTLQRDDAAVERAKSAPSEAGSQATLQRREFQPQSQVGAATGSTQCNPGFVPRMAGPSDYICVTKESQQRAAQENAMAASRRNPGGGAYGPNTCLAGFVWRGAFAGDVVCVTPEMRRLVQQENEQSSSRSSGPGQFMRR